jgi:hypothetical protein
MNTPLIKYLLKKYTLSHRGNIRGHTLQPTTNWFMAHRGMPASSLKTTVTSLAHKGVTLLD